VDVVVAHSAEAVASETRAKEPSGRFSGRSNTVAEPPGREKTTFTNRPSRPGSLQDV
jgi:hypothetical protein